MHLKDILKGIEFKAKDDISDFEVRNVTSDSKAVRKGDFFIAFRGYSLDGYDFIDEAISRGAKAILAERGFRSPPSVKKIFVKDTRTTLPIIADNFYDHPSKRLKMIGVTGTNGKTTITYIIENILKNAGRSTGVIGTINYRLKRKELDARNTTPGPLELQRLLADMVKGSLNYCVMEVSSHSLVQHRVDCVTFDVGIFTNITSEHLDYHKTIRNYFLAKAKLLDKLREDGAGILNSDVELVAGLKSSLKRKVITYGIKKDADVKALRINADLEGSSFIAMTPRGPIDIKTRLIGMHNISNILASVACALSLHIDLGAIKRGVESTRLVPGRLQAIDLGQPFKVFLDYAHTEDALYNILSLLRRTAKKDIITIFGCGGNRDRKKRPRMGNVACRFSDKVIITSDNPRFEDPYQIIAEIEKGIKGKFSNYDIIEERRKAIGRALDLASADDIVVIAGKGHEKHQIIRDEMMPFDDCEIARTILRKKYANTGNIKDNSREAVERKS